MSSDPQIIELRAAIQRTKGHCAHVKAAVGKLNMIEADALALANWATALVENVVAEPAKPDPVTTAAAAPSPQPPVTATVRQPPANLFTKPVAPEEPKMPPGAVRPYGNREPPPLDMIAVPQMHEIQQLLADKGVSEQTLSGWLRGKFNVKTADSLTMIQAQTVIDGMKKMPDAADKKSAG